MQQLLSFPPSNLYSHFRSTHSTVQCSLSFHGQGTANLLRNRTYRYHLAHAPSTHARDKIQWGGYGEMRISAGLSRSFFDPYQGSMAQIFIVYEAISHLPEISGNSGTVAAITINGHMANGNVDSACSTCPEGTMETKVTRERLITFLLETPMFEKLDPSEIMEIIHIVEDRAVSGRRYCIQ